MHPLRWVSYNHHYLSGSLFGLEEFLYQRAHQIVVLTSAFKDVLTDNKSVVADKIAVIPNGADIVMTDALYNRLISRRFGENMAWPMASGSLCRCSWTGEWA